MASSFSQPGCIACASLNVNVGCGVCAARKDSTFETIATRATIIKRAVKRMHSVATLGMARVATLQCPNKHTWRTTTTPGRDDSVEDPQCPTCDQYFATMGLIRGVYAEDVVCLDKCKNAKDCDCRCSCAGANHGINLGNFKYIRTPKR